MKILIVEDDTDSRIYLERALLSQGYSVKSADNGVAALEQAEKSPPDLIISDILMPGMDGFELCRRVKTDERLHTIPFVFYTATYTEPKDEELAMTLGASRFLIKPMEPDDLLMAIQAVIDKYLGKSLEVPLQPLAEMKDLDRMQLEVLARKLDKKVRELEEEREARKRAAEALKKANEELEMRVAERTDELENNRMELELQNEKLQETYHELERETAERIRVLEELRGKDQMLIQQSRMAAMGELLCNIAHHWRQPLNVLGLKVQEIGLSYELGGFSKELLDANIAKAMEILQHLSRTIDDFRDFSAPDREKSLFRVDRVVAKTISLIEDNFTELGIAIEVGTSGEPQINGFPNEYSQVLLNLLTNARDALLERGTNDPRVMVRSWTEDGRAVLTVTDNAGGIKEEIMGKIFDAYFSTKEVGKGTGVGLFMSKIIIEKNMGGRLTVRNAAGGAEFRVEV